MYKKVTRYEKSERGLVSKIWLNIGAESNITERASLSVHSAILTADVVFFILGLRAVSLEVAEHGGGHVALAHAAAIARRRRRRLARTHVILARLLRCILLGFALCRVPHFCKNNEQS